MGKLYDFKRLIDKYSVEFTLVSSATGSYVNGKYVSGEETTSTQHGAIVPVSNNKLYQSGGAITTKDRQLIMKSPISNALTNCKVRYLGNEYNIEQETDYTEYADAHIYLLKWVSSFD